ncbi:MAG: patatin-like phospholipase family protein [Bacteroidota bacterium]
MKKRALFLFLVLPIFILSFLQCAPPTKETETQTDVETSSSKVIVLAVDGGGIKGVIPATFLQAIEKQAGKQSYQSYDVIGGTSTGGIISVALTSPDTTKKPFTADEIVNIYKNDGDKIFVAQGCTVELCAKYYSDNGSGQGIEPYLQSVVGSGTSLTDNYTYLQSQPGARVKQLFTTSYIVNSTGNVVSNPTLGTDYGPYLFNWYDANNSSNDDYYLWEAARGTSAAPTYFPVAQVGGSSGSRSASPQKWVVDGGMMSNDPAVWGVTEALRTGLAKSLDDIIVVSLGTGVYPGNAGVGIHNNAGGLFPDNGNWSTTPWVISSMYDLEGVQNDRGTIVNVILDAVQLVTNSQLEAMQRGGLTYYRLEPSLTKAQSNMDDINPANIQSLITSANNYLSGDGAATLAKIVSALKNN